MNKVSLLTILILLSIPSVGFAQGFPWNDFKPRTLKEIVNMDSKEINDSDDQNRVIFHADMLLSVVRVKYTGKTRPIEKVKTEFLKKWAKTFSENADQYASNYEEDLLFTEEGVDYWLPVQKKVIPYFSKELQAGDDVDIYMVRAGGICKKRVCDWLFLVEEFQKPKTVNKN